MSSNLFPRGHTHPCRGAFLIKSASSQPFFVTRPLDDEPNRPPCSTQKYVLYRRLGRKLTGTLVTVSVCGFAAIITTLFRLWIRRGRLWWDDAWAGFSFLVLL